MTEFLLIFLNSDGPTEGVHMQTKWYVSLYFGVIITMPKTEINLFRVGKRKAVHTVEPLKTEIPRDRPKCPS